MVDPARDAGLCAATAQLACFAHLVVVHLSSAFWPGLAIYAVFGRIYLPKRRIEQQLRASQRIRSVQAQMGPQAYAQPELPPHLAPIVTLATRLGDFGPAGVETKSSF